MCTRNGTDSRKQRGVAKIGRAGRVHTGNFLSTCGAERRANAGLCNVRRKLSLAKEIVTRKQARQLGLNRYFTGKPCIRGHISERRTVTKLCLECSKARAEKWRAKNPGKNKEYSKKWRAADPERARIGVRKSLAKWRPKNKHKKAYETRLRDARKAQRTPVWADLLAIQKVYEMARDMNEKTGEEWQVDHIIPLQGKLVSGLHVHANLQVLPALENARKHNSFRIE